MGLQRWGKGGRRREYSSDTLVFDDCIALIATNDVILATIITEYEKRKVRKLLYMNDFNFY